MRYARFIILSLVVAFLLPVVVSARMESVTLQGSVGRLSAVVQCPDIPEGKKVPMVIIMHGFGADKEGSMLRFLADSLESKGIASIRFDFNSHGRSEGDFRNMTVLNEIEDAEQVYRYVRRLGYVGRIGLIGHSQGGVVASMLAGRLGHRISSVVLLAPAAVLRDDAIRGNTMGAVYDPLNPPEYMSVSATSGWGASSSAQPSPCPFTRRPPVTMAALRSFTVRPTALCLIPMAYATMKYGSGAAFTSSMALTTAFHKTWNVSSVLLQTILPEIWANADGSVLGLTFSDEIEYVPSDMS